MKLDTINWEEEAQQFLETHGNDDNHIHEWVDNLVPIFYYDIMVEANRAKVYHEKIKEQEAANIFQYRQSAIKGKGMEVVFQINAMEQGDKEKNCQQR